MIVYKRYTRLNCHIFFIKNYTSYCKSYLCFVLNNTNRNIFCNKQKYLVGRKYKNRPHSKSHSNAPKLSRPVSFTILSLSGIAPMGKFTIANSKILLALKSLNDAESVSHTRIRQKKWKWHQSPYVNLLCSSQTFLFFRHSRLKSRKFVVLQVHR